ncbi:MAG: Prolipoprotein diacylglyceryl transferase [Acidimicrobiales bacterium]|jgi:prolipoprotein diacylglyceryl transferase|nr:Prolipoprotein diacylglyceryl transferase [Acidimicrobiales bacterium]
MLAYIPSPSSGAIHIGPLQIRAYGLMIALGVLAAVKLASARWERRGGNPEDLTAVATWAVPAGLVGARLYHVITDYQRFQGRWLHAFAIWEGGLGIWGGVALGALVGWFVARRRGLDATAMLDACAPAIPLAQAIGRLGNWFNQELFGRPTTLPWGLEIDPAHRPAGYLDVATFHPTFLYESLWNLLVVFVVVWADRHFNMSRGRLFAFYVACYTVGRFWIEALRIDDAHHVLGLRLNDWTSILVFAAAVAFLLLRKPTPATDAPLVDVGSSDSEQPGHEDTGR